MKLEQAGSYRLAWIMKKFGVDRDTARKIKSGEDVDVNEQSEAAAEVIADQSDEEGKV